MASKALDWVGVLNALAGTTNMGAALAANIYAGWNYTANGLLDTHAALCHKAGVAIRDYDLNGVCNKLAGLAPGTLDSTAALNYALYGHWPV